MYIFKRTRNTNLFFVNYRGKFARCTANFHFFICFVRIKYFEIFKFQKNDDVAHGIFGVAVCDEEKVGRHPAREVN